MNNLTSNEINKLERKVGGKGAVREGKRLTLFISNEDTNDVIKIIKPLEDSGVLTDGVSETVKHEIKQERGFLGTLLAHLIASIMQPVMSSRVKGISGRRVRQAGVRYMIKNI